MSQKIMVFRVVLTCPKSFYEIRHTTFRYIDVHCARAQMFVCTFMSSKFFSWKMNPIYYCFKWSYYPNVLNVIELWSVE